VRVGLAARRVPGVGGVWLVHPYPPDPTLRPGLEEGRQAGTNGEFVDPPIALIKSVIGRRICPSGCGLRV
jgi:hypothetical protein